MNYIYIILLILVFSHLVLILNDEDKKKIKESINEHKRLLTKKFNERGFILSLVVILLTNIFIFFFFKYTNSSSKFKSLLTSSIEKGNVALIIAVCAYLDILIFPFWIVFLLSFIYHMDI